MLPKGTRVRLSWGWSSLIALLFVTGVCGSAAAQNLQDFFGLTAPETIGKLKADNSTVTCTSSVLRTKSACSDGSYAAQCVSGVCGCINYDACKNSGGTIGTGSEGTLEIGVDFANGPTLGLAPDCYPIFGVYKAAGKSDPSGEEIDFDGVACDPLSGNVVVINGGWQLIGWGSKSIVDGAGGTTTGTLNLSTSEVKLSLKGKTF
jgi:hypothetical protein